MGGKSVRFRADGDKPGKRNAWAILYFDKRPAGAFGSYRMGLKQRWKANDLNELSPAEKQKLQREWAEARQRREQESFEGHRRVAVEAQRSEERRVGKEGVRMCRYRWETYQ